MLLTPRLAGWKDHRISLPLDNLGDAGYVAVIGQMLNVQNGRSQFPVPIYSGRHGCAKPSTAHHIRSAIDPALIPAGQAWEHTIGIFQGGQR
jgi:hypothetical protein